MRASAAHYSGWSRALSTSRPSAYPLPSVALTNHPTPAILPLEVSMSDAVFDQTLLREKAYADDSHLDVRRRTHQLYTCTRSILAAGRWSGCRGAATSGSWTWAAAPADLLRGDGPPARGLGRPGRL